MSRNQRRNRRNKSGGGSANANAGANRSANSVHDDQTAPAVRLRSSTETKSSLKTTELVAYAGAVLAVVMTALALDADGRGGDDPFGAEAAIRYITYLTIGYMIARGLAKSGSHENRVERDTTAGDDAAPIVMTDDEEGQDDLDGPDRGADHRPDRPVDSTDETEHERAEPASMPATSPGQASTDEVGARS